MLFSSPTSSKIKGHSQEDSLTSPWGGVGDMSSLEETTFFTPVSPGSPPGGAGASILKPLKGRTVYLLSPYDRCDAVAPANQPEPLKAKTTLSQAGAGMMRI